MTFQSTVSLKQGFGVAGEFFDGSPHRAEPFILQSADPGYNVFGRAFTVVSEGIAQAGGTGVFAGFLVSPKSATSVGTVAGGTLAPTLTLPNNVLAEILNMGCIIVSLPDAAAIGDLVIYDEVTGELATVIPAGPVPAGFQLAHAVVDRFTVDSAGLAVIRVTDVPVTP
jgi:hypothetical protein